MRLIVCAVLLALVLVPLVGVATDDLSEAGTPHDSGLRHQPARGWRTMPAAVDPPAQTPHLREVATLDVNERAAAPTPFARPLFVPPRG